MIEAEKFYSVKQIAEELNVSARTIRDRLNRSPIPVTKPGIRTYRYKGKDLMSFGLVPYKSSSPSASPESVKPDQPKEVSIDSPPSGSVMEIILPKGFYSFDLIARILEVSEWEVAEILLRHGIHHAVEGERSGRVYGADLIRSGLAGPAKEHNEFLMTETDRLPVLTLHHDGEYTTYQLVGLLGPDLTTVRHKLLENGIKPVQKRFQPLRYKASDIIQKGLPWRRVDHPGKRRRGQG